MASRSEELNDFERRLSGLAPAADGLSPETMLYASGLAAARRSRGRVVWPALAAGFAILAVGLGRQLVLERGERAALTAELHRARQAATASAATGPLLDDRPRSVQGPDTLLASHRLIENGLGDVPPSRSNESTLRPALEQEPMLRAWPLKAMPDL
jgi:hypothetical protein